MSTLVTYDTQDGIATITMDDGKRNALTLGLLEELRTALDRAAHDQVVVVLTGREGVFSAGFDLKVLSAGGVTAVKLLQGGFELSQRLLSFPLPVVIACGGHAMAMGAFLLLSGDYRIGVQGPFKLSANEVAIGMTLPHCAIEICRQRLTPAHFNRATILAEVYGPEAAIDAGFLDRVVPQAELLDTANKLAADLSKLNMKAHTATKERVRAVALQAIRAAFDVDAKAFNIYA
jgi:enoyl-CoA hydratase